MAKWANDGECSRCGYGRLPFSPCLSALLGHVQFVAGWLHAQVWSFSKPAHSKTSCWWCSRCSC